MKNSRQISDRQKFDLRQKITNFAKSIGFDLVGFSPAKIEKKYLKAFEEWLAEGREGTMEYMRKIEQRRDLTKILPGAKTVIVFGLNYFHEQPALPRGHGRIARYAYGRDYHKVIGKKLKQVEKFIMGAAHFLQNCTHNVHTKSQDKYLTYLSAKSARADFRGKTTAPESHFVSDSPPRGGHIARPGQLTKSYVDTGPILERALAEQAGIGRIGKNGCVISKEFGSWIFLSEIITTLDLNFKKVSPASTAHPVTLFDRWRDPAEKPFNVCGNCNKCMAACPTGAIIAPGVVDSRLCISYLTIENRKKIPPKLAKIIKKNKRLFGCDICQEVCPHNRARQRSRIGKLAKLNSLPGVRQDANTTLVNQVKPQTNLDGLLTPIADNSLSLKKLPTSDTAFLRAFAGSPLMRAKRRGLKRNAKTF